MAWLVRSLPGLGRDAPSQVELAHVAEEELQVVLVVLLHQWDDGAGGLEASLQDSLQRQRQAGPPPDRLPLAPPFGPTEPGQPTIPPGP